MVRLCGYFSVFRIGRLIFLEYFVIYFCVVHDGKKIQETLETHMAPTPCWQHAYSRLNFTHTRTFSNTNSLSTYFGGHDLLHFRWRKPKVKLPSFPVSRHTIFPYHKNNNKSRDGAVACMSTNEFTLHPSVHSK